MDSASRMRRVASLRATLLWITSNVKEDLMHTPATFVIAVATAVERGAL
jgi:hypothetical protein